MKRVLFWKWFDIVGQGLMVLPLLAIFSDSERAVAMLTYLTVGGWQILSCGINAVISPVPASAERMRYARMLGWVLGIFGGTVFLAWAFTYGGHQYALLETMRIIFFWTALLEACLLLIVGPLMAFWYAGITMDEIGAIKHREEIHWKL
jgi:hypothetical protein